MENYSDTRFDNAVRVVCEKIRKYLKLLPADIKKQAQEIRLRVNQPVSICCTNGIYFLKHGEELNKVWQSLRRYLQRRA